MGRRRLLQEARELMNQAEGMITDLEYEVVQKNHKLYPGEDTRRASAVIETAERAWKLLELAEVSETLTGCEALAILSKAYFMLGHYDQAIACCRRALALLPGEPSSDREVDVMQMLEFLLGLMLHKSMYHHAEALTLLRRVLTRPRLSMTRSIRCRTTIARVLYSRRQYAEAAHECETALGHAGADAHPLERLPVLESLADIAEAQGDMDRARHFDKLVCDLAEEHGCTNRAGRALMEANRRTALLLLERNDPKGAWTGLQGIFANYVNYLERCQLLNDLVLTCLRAVSVLADALRASGESSLADMVEADVNDTQSILDGMTQAALQETRQEMRGRRGVPGGDGQVRVRRASRKKKKRQAKQKARGEQRRRDGEDQQQQQQEQQERGEGNGDGERCEGHGHEGAAGLVEEEEVASHNISLEGGARQDLYRKEHDEEPQGQVGQEVSDDEAEEEAVECAVCLCDLTEAEVETGPALLCGHVYHAECLQRWFDKCQSKGIPPTCPYCRQVIVQVG